MEHNNIIRGLSIMTSCGCNLNCEYCRIAQSVNAGSATLQHNTIKALQDGSFLTNVTNALYRCEQSPKTVDSIAFWGQEPTLTLHIMAEHLQEWFEVFPNWSNCMFSTNSIDHMDRIIAFIAAAEQHTKQPIFRLDLQLSYDGEYSTEKFRGADASKIHNNVTYLITELNKLKLDKVTVHLNFHGVLSMELLKDLSNLDALYQHAFAAKKWGEEFQKLNTNKNVLIPTRGIDLGIENPVNASIDDGIRLRNFGDLSKRIPLKELYPELTSHNYEQMGPVTLHESLYGGAAMILERFVEFCDNHRIPNLRELVHLIAENEQARTDLFTMLNMALYCGNGVAELKFLWDGTLVNCQNHIYETKADLLPIDNNDLVASVKRSLALHDYFINPLTATDYELDRYFDLFHSCKYSSFEFVYRTTITLMQFLVETGQIDESYKNTEKLLAHALIVSTLNCCSYNNQVTTGSLFVRPTGFIRLWCNGHLDNVCEHFNKHFGREVF